MQHIGAFDAKTHFSRLIAEVEQGKSFIITKHGHIVAKLIPTEELDETSNQVAVAIQNIKKLRKGVTLGKKLTIKQLREEGRR